MPLHRREFDGKYPAFTSVGCYTVVYLTKDGGTLCADCANGENGSDASETADDPSWRLVDADVYWEGPTLQCDHCNADIESSYGDPDAPDPT